MPVGGTDFFFFFKLIFSFCAAARVSERASGGSKQHQARWSGRAGRGAHLIGTSGSLANSSSSSSNSEMGASKAKLA